MTVARDDEPLPAAARRDRELPWAVLAHPLVQITRFAAKLVVAWAAGPSDYGAVASVAVVLFLVRPLACLGLEDALVWAERLDRRLLRQARHRLLLIASGLAALLALVAAWMLQGELVPPQSDSSACSLPLALLLLAPLVPIQAFACLPVALLIRAGRYRATMIADLAGVLALAAGLALGLALGFGAMAMVIAWWLQSVVHCALAHRFSAVERGALPRGEGEAAAPGIFAYGRRAGGAAFFAGLAQRADVSAIGLGMGQRALGLYEMAQHLATPVLAHATNLSERFLLPALAETRGDAWFERRLHRALRLVLAWGIPAHIGLAALAPTLVAVLLHEEWSLVGVLLVPLALCSALRLGVLLPRTALLATGRARALAILSALETGAMVVVLGVGLAVGESLVTLAWTVLAVRAIAGLATVWAARQRQRPRVTLDSLRGLRFGIALWSFGILALAHHWQAEGPMGWGTLAVFLTGAGLAWAVVRWRFDRVAFFKEGQRLLKPPRREG